MNSRKLLTLGVLIVLIGGSVALGEGRGTWAIRTPMPSARTEVAAVEAGAKIYVIGGFGQSTLDVSLMHGGRRC